MDVEITIALPEDLRAELDRRAPTPAERDALVSAAVRAYFSRSKRGDDSGDLSLINERADELNEEAADALSYQDSGNEPPPTEAVDRVRLLSDLTQLWTTDSGRSHGVRATREEIYDRKVLRSRGEPLG